MISGLLITSIELGVIFSSYPSTWTHESIVNFETKLSYYVQELKETLPNQDIVIEIDHLRIVARVWKDVICYAMGNDEIEGV